jgi:hypothetical protein
LEKKQKENNAKLLEQAQNNIQNNIVSNNVETNSDINTPENFLNKKKNRPNKKNEIGGIIPCNISTTGIKLIPENNSEDLQQFTKTVNIH